MTHRGRRGFSLVEILATVATLATLTSVGVVVVSKARTATVDLKLDQDVKTLNEAVRVYQTSGGDLSGATSASAVLAKLKTRAADASAKTVVGQTGPFIDLRLAARTTTTSGTPRAVWDATAKRFTIATTGAGVTEFYTDNALAAATPTTETRSTAQRFASHDAWVWDSDPSEPQVQAAPPADNDTSDPSTLAYRPQSAPVSRPLLPPEISLPGGLIPYDTYKTGITISNPNDAATSRVVYSLNDGPWATYTAGTQLKLPTDQLTSTIKTYVIPLNSDTLTESPLASNTYQTIYFKGGTEGTFSLPVGDTNLVTNLTGGRTGTKFTWGTPGEHGDSPNWLQFSAAGNFWVLPEQEFKIGELQYYNGSTLSGTNATAVQLDVVLNLQVPESKEKLSFTLKLLSTPNYGRDTDADADYVWIPTLSSKFSATVQGQTFYLQLRFGKSTGNSFTTIDEFHVREDKTATGAIYGKLTTNPQF